MKTKLFAALLALSVMLFCSCEGEDNTNFPAQYVLFLELVDSQDRNISKLAGDNANVEVFDSQDLSKLPSVHGSMISREDNICRFSLIAYGGFGENRSELTWNIRCKELFGDDNLHILQSNWVQGLPEFWAKVCTSFTFEGKTYVPELKNGNWTTKVVINR